MGLRPILRRGRLRYLRVVVLALVALALLSLGQSFLAYDASAGNDTAAPDGPGATMVATIDATGPGQIVAYGPDGDVAYENTSRWLYHDVDPEPGGAQTVEYVASEQVHAGRCSATDWCMMNVVERVNISTGETTRVHTWVSDHDGSSQIHGVDRIDESTLLVGDIRYPDRVFAVNTTTDEVVWEWNVSAAYEPESGGVYPDDWTHLNDVEWVTIDGRGVAMVSLRNQDSVVFVDPEAGLLDEWTLGADDDHDVLYEQHNPDYIPEERGGPAILVADSENNRVVEYQRENGSWVRSWRWADERLQWPRDADRMPNGNTVVADSHGSRILSVAPNGSVAWSRSFPDGSYDVEVLGTGDESGGPSAARMESADADPTGFTHRVVALVPPLVLHGALFALPIWANALDAVLLLAAASVTLVWLLAEAVVRIGPRLGRLRSS